jgi:predicted metalloprotease with PDZ domain
MRSKLSRMMMVACLLWMAAAVRPALAQPTLQRLEHAIRDRVAQASDASTPADAPAEVQPAAAQPVPQPPVVRQGSQAERERGYLGAVVDDKNDRGRGVRVLEVRTDGPAAKGGLKTGDLITAIATMRVRQLADMADVLSLYPPGDTVAIDVLRDDKPQQVKITLGRSPVASAPGLPTATPPSATAAVIPRLLPGAATDQTARIEQLQHRVDELEQRVAELEKALAEVTKNK